MSIKRKGMIVSALLVALMVVSGVVVPAGAAREPSIDPIESLSLTHLDVCERSKAVGRLELRCFTEGLSMDDVNAISADVIAMAKAKGLLDEDRLLLEEEIYSCSERVIVAVATIVHSDGTKSGYLGRVSLRSVTQIEQAVRHIQQRTQEWFRKQILQGPELLPERECEVGVMGGWTLIRRGGRRLMDSPYGAVENHFSVWQLAGETEAADYYAVRQCFGMEPGINAWASDWRNYRGRPMNDWGWNPRVLFLRDWAPPDNVGGTAVAQTEVDPDGKSILVALGIVSPFISPLIEWLFADDPPDVVVTADPSLVHCYAAWDVDFSGDGINRVVMLRLGSLSETNPVSGGQRLLRAQSVGRFRDPHPLWPDPIRTVSHTWNIIR